MARRWRLEVQLIAALRRERESMEKLLSATPKGLSADWAAGQADTEETTYHNVGSAFRASSAARTSENLVEEFERIRKRLRPSVVTAIIASVVGVTLSLLALFNSPILIPYALAGAAEEAGQRGDRTRPTAVAAPNVLVAESKSKDASTPKHKHKQTIRVQAQEAAAQPAEWRDFGGWKLHCVTSTQRTCQLSQKRIDANSKATVVWLEIDGDSSSRSNVTVMVLTPLGTRLTPPAPLVINGQDVARIPVLTCVASGCVQKRVAPRKVVDSWTAANAMSVEIVSQTGQSAQVALDPSGFKEGMAALESFVDR